MAQTDLRSCRAPMESVVEPLVLDSVQKSRGKVTGTKRIYFAGIDRSIRYAPFPSAMSEVLQVALASVSCCGLASNSGGGAGCVCVESDRSKNISCSERIGPSPNKSYF